MQLYDILQDGFHTPLQATQIAELFHAGQVGRNTRCKPAEQQKWRTIDELFPLLKYHTPWQLGYQPPHSPAGSRLRPPAVVAMCLVGAAVAALVIYLCFQARGFPDRRITTIDSIPESAVAPDVRSAPVLFTQTTRNTVAPSPTRRFSGGSAGSMPAPAEQTGAPSATRLAEARRIADQARRDQAVIESQRLAKAQSVVAQQELTGRDEPVPLDRWQVVNVGGESVSVKIHDNDVTSFDVWINGSRRREVKKEKGITGSRTDEILIYNNGRAALYYVWEISKLGHCMLRVRDA